MSDLRNFRRVQFDTLIAVRTGIYSPRCAAGAGLDWNGAHHQTTPTQGTFSFPCLVLPSDFNPALPRPLAASFHCKTTSRLRDLAQKVPRFTPMTETSCLGRHRSDVTAHVVSNMLTLFLIYFFPPDLIPRLCPRKRFGQQ